MIIKFPCLLSLASPRTISRALLAVSVPFSKPNSSLLPCWSSCPSPLPLHSRSFLPSSCIRQSGYHTTPRQTLRPRGPFLHSTPPSISFIYLAVPTPGSSTNLHHLCHTPTRTIIPFRALHPAFTRQSCREKHTTPTSEDLPRRSHGVASEETSVETSGNCSRCA